MEDDFELFEEVDRRMRAIFEETFRESPTSLFDVEARSLKPLFKIEANEEEVIVMLDLPYVEKDDIELDTTADTLSIHAKMRKIVTIHVGGALQRRVEFEKFSRRIRLPVKVDPTRAKATFTRGMLRITYPVVRGGTVVEIR